MRDGGCERAAVPAPPLPVRCDPAASPSLLRPGCHLLEFARQGEPAYLDGTLRVEATAGGMVASGDLYARPQADPAVGGSVEPPDPAAGIPIFPVADYLCYLRVTGIDQSAEGVTLTIEEHRFHEPGIEFLDGTRQWFVGSTFTVPLAPDGPALTGTFVDSLSTVSWQVTARWVAPSLRRATLEIDRVPLSEWPDTSGTATTMGTVFDEIGWDLTVIRSHADVTETTGESWSGTEAHAMMAALRDRSDLDAEWRYHCLAVRRMDIGLSNTGWMYDRAGAVAREGFMVASHWVVPTEPLWGRAQGKRFGTVAPAYFRTALHELGHAMGLQHNPVNSIMMDTAKVAGLGVATPFPDNIVMSFAADDRHRLRHWPDLVVRPGTPVKDGGSAPIGPAL